MANEQLPNSINKKFEELDDSLTDLQNSLKPFLKMPVTDIREKVTVIFALYTFFYKHGVIFCGPHYI